MSSGHTPYIEAVKPKGEYQAFEVRSHSGNTDAVIVTRGQVAAVEVKSIGADLASDPRFRERLAARLAARAKGHGAAHFAELFKVVVRDANHSNYRVFRTYKRAFQRSKLMYDSRSKDTRGNVEAILKAWRERAQAGRDESGEQQNDQHSLHKIQAMKLAEATATGKVDQAGLELYRNLTAILRTKDFAGCDAFLAAVDVKRTDLSLLVSVLVGTAKMPRDKLPSRPALYEQILQRYVTDRSAAEAGRALGSLR